MDSIPVPAVDAKTFQQVLMALLQKNYLGDSSSVSDDRLLQLYASVNYSTTEDIRSETNLFETILIQAVDEHWEVDKLDSFLSDREFSIEYKKVFLSVWRRERDRIHLSNLRRVTFSDRLETLSWRVDSKVMSKTSSDINQPVAFVEMLLKKHDQKFNAVAKFEMSLDEVQIMLRELEHVQEAFGKINSNSSQ